MVATVKYLLRHFLCYAGDLQAFLHVRAWRISFALLFLLPFVPRRASLPQVFYVNQAKEQTQKDQDVQYLDKTKGMRRHKIDIWV